MTETIRPLEEADVPAALALFAEAARRHETLDKPITAADYAARFQGENRVALGAFDGKRLIGWIHGAVPSRFLHGETADSAPLYLTLLVVAPDKRRRGVGTALLRALEAEARRLGKSRVAVSDRSPVARTWLIPGTPDHDHNNAPGVDEDSAGYGFLLRRGYREIAHGVAMYMAMAEHRPDPGLRERVAALAAEGIRVGRWEPGLGGRFDGLCDRVGSEYWRHVLQEELAAWREHRPNADPELWPDGRRPSGPRTLLTATHGENIIGFTGPVDLQRSGRGWFTGICVDPLWQGRGIATALFQLLMEEFHAEGAAFCSLFTGRDNPARRIYERAGLRVAARFCAMERELG